LICFNEETVKISSPSCIQVEYTHRIDKSVVLYLKVWEFLKGVKSISTDILMYY